MHSHVSSTQNRPITDPFLLAVCSRLSLGSELETGDFCTLSSAGCILFPSHAAGRPHSRLNAKHTPLYPPDISAMLPLRELWLACLPPACTHE